MKVDIWFPFYVNDYIADTMDLSTIEHGIYVLLFCHYWKKRGNLTKDIKKLQSITKTDDETLPLLYGILSEYFIEKEDCYSNKRLDKELLKAESKREAASINGRKGGRPKKLNETQKKANPKLEENSSSSSSSSSSSKPIEKKHKYGIYHHVKFTDSQYNKILEDYGKERGLELITKVDDAIEMHGYTYKNHNLTLRKWFPLDKEKQIINSEELTENQKEIEKYQNYIDSDVFPEAEKVKFRNIIKGLEGENA